MENIDQPASANQGQPLDFANEVKNFYKGDFKTLLAAFFADPFDGIQAIFRQPSGKTFIHAMILFGTVFALYFIGTYLLAGDFREFISFSNFISFGLIPILTMLSVSGLAWLIKASTGSKPVFKNELLTGAMCGIPMALVIPLSLLARVFGSGADVITLVRSPFSAGMLMSLIMLYLLIMMINVLQQSLKAAGVKDLLAWYLSPLCILLSFYAAFSVFGEML